MKAELKAELKSSCTHKYSSYDLIHHQNQFQRREMLGHCPLGEKFSRKLQMNLQQKFNLSYNTSEESTY